MIEYEYWDYPVEGPSDEEIKARGVRERQEEIDALKANALKAIDRLSYWGDEGKSALEEVAAAVKTAQSAKETRLAEQEAFRSKIDKIVTDFQLQIVAREQQ